MQVGVRHAATIYLKFCRRCHVKKTITASIILLVGGGLFDATWSCSECTVSRCFTVGQVAAKNEATVTLVVGGMMKSKSGAT